MRSSPLTKGGTQPPALGANSPNHWTTRKVPMNELFNHGLLLILFVAHLCSFTYVPRCYCCCWVASVVSDSVRPHRRQPTRLPGPWDSPGKNTGVDCHFLLQCMKVKSENWKRSRSVVSDSTRPQGLQPMRRPHRRQPTRLPGPWDFPGKSTGVSWGQINLTSFAWLKIFSW